MQMLNEPTSSHVPPPVLPNVSFKFSKFKTVVLFNSALILCGEVAAASSKPSMLVTNWLLASVGGKYAAFYRSPAF